MIIERVERASQNGFHCTRQHKAIEKVTESPKLLQIKRPMHTTCNPRNHKKPNPLCKITNLIYGKFIKIVILILIFNR